VTTGETRERRHHPVRRIGRRWRRSIRWRLVTLFVLLALATSAVFIFGMRSALHGGWEGYAQPLLNDYADRIVGDLGIPPSPVRARQLERELPVRIRIEGPVAQYGQPPRHRHFGSPLNRWELKRTTADGHVVAIGLARLPHDGPDPVSGWYTLLALLGLTGLVFVAVRRLLAPLSAIGAGVERYGQGDFSTAIPVQRADELGELSERINRMAHSLHGMLDAKRALLLAISHELRSPLTRARVNAELLDATPEQAALLRDLGQMRDLIADLLESERLAADHVALQAESVRAADLLDEVLAAWPGGPPALTREVAPDVPAIDADPTRLRLLMRNLLDNALRHSGNGAAVPVVSLQPERGGCRLTVRDHGPGVPPEHLPHLTEAFYRADSARQRSTGGVGLGLYLCRLVAQAHGGSLEVSNAQPGLRVSVWLPLRREAGKS